MDRPLAWAALVFLVLIGIGGLALLVLAPDYVQARLDGLQPASLQSNLRANYAMDPLGILLQQVSFKAVEEIIADHATSSQSAKYQIATVIGDLLTPVYNTTPTRASTSPFASPTIAARFYTSTAQAFTPSLPAAATVTTPTPDGPVSETVTASSTHTLVPTPPGTTATNTLRPTATLKPSITPKLPGATATLSNQPSATSTPSRTSTLISISTSTQMYTATFSPVPPTRTFTPKPPTKTFTQQPTHTLPAYPPPKTTIPPYP
jgi:hypothetical protein